MRHLLIKMRKYKYSRRVRDDCWFIGDVILPVIEIFYIGRVEPVIHKIRPGNIVSFQKFRGCGTGSYCSREVAIAKMRDLRVEISGEPAPDIVDEGDTPWILPQHIIPLINRQRIVQLALRKISEKYRLQRDPKVGVSCPPRK